MIIFTFWLGTKCRLSKQKLLILIPNSPLRTMHRVRTIVRKLRYCISFFFCSISRFLLLYACHTSFSLSRNTMRFAFILGNTWTPSRHVPSFARFLLHSRNLLCSVFGSKCPSILYARNSLRVLYNFVGQLLWNVCQKLGGWVFIAVPGFAVRRPRTAPVTVLCWDCSLSCDVGRQ